MTEDKGTYLVFTADTTEEQARAAFVRRYGIEPEKINRLYPTELICAGPIPQPEPLTA